MLAKVQERFSDKVTSQDRKYCNDDLLMAQGFPTASHYQMVYLWAASRFNVCVCVCVCMYICCGKTTLISIMVSPS